MKLTDKRLPDAITADGSRFLLNTDFRVWLTFPERIKSYIDGNEDPYEELFTDYIPYLTQEVLDALNEFYNPPKEVPRITGNNKNVLDYEIDAEYIYAAFMQAYGIDLIDTDMHWHKFQALFNALPEDTMIVKLMHYRSYEGSSKDIGHQERVELRQMWELPTKYTPEEQAEIDKFNELFG